MGVELLSASSSSLSFTDAMGEFLQKFDGHPSLPSCFKPGEVQDTLSTLLQFIADRSGEISQNASVVFQALCCIKLLTRTRTELEILLQDDNISALIGLASHDICTDIKFRNAIVNEAIRILINLCIIHQNEAVPILHRQRIHQQLLDLLESVPAVSDNDNLIFAISRLLFYISLDDRFQRSFSDASNVPRMLAAKIVQYEDSFDPGSVSLRSDITTPDATYSALSELLRLLFAISSNKDLLQDRQEVWQILTPSLLRLLLGQSIDIMSLSTDDLQKMVNSPYYLLMLDIVHLFFCFDEASMRSLLEKEVIHRVLSLLEIQARYNCANVETALTPILTVLKNLCELNSDISHYAKEYVFGVEFANDKTMKYEFETGDTTLSMPSVTQRTNQQPPPLYKILRQLITTFNPNVKDAVSRFLFTVCGQDPSEYIRVVGFGNAIGLLTQMNLPGFQMLAN